MKNSEREGGLTRREFVGAVGGLIAASAGCNEGSAKDVADKRIDRIGIQLYTIRDEMKKDLAGTLARVARTGYKEVEFAGYFGKSPKEVRSILRQNGLTSPAAHIGIPVLGSEWDKILEDANVIGQRYVICPWIDEKDRTVDGYKKMVDLFNKAGERAKAEGLQFAYHNHDFEFKPIQGRLPYDMIIEETDPALVKMEMDVFWLTKGGQSPVAYFRRYPGRFPCLHIKDMDASGKMVDVGKGVIPWRTVLARRDVGGTKHIFVEHDQPPEPYPFIRNSYRYLRTLSV